LSRHSVLATADEGEPSMPQGDFADSSGAAMSPRNTFRPDHRILATTQAGWDLSQRPREGGSDLAFGLSQTGDAVAWLPLATFLHQLHPLKSLEHVTFTAQCGRRAQTSML